MNKIIFSFVIAGIILTCGSVAAFGQKSTRKTSPKAKTIAAKSKAVKTKTVSAKRKQSSKKNFARTLLSRPDGKILNVTPDSSKIYVARPSESQTFRLGNSNVETLGQVPTISERPSGEISGGVVNGKAINLVTPPYPPQAKAVRASGQVLVQVLIDENGDVISATAVSGNPLLRAAAAQAARASTFKPTLLEGKPVKISGVIIYNFASQ